MQASYGNGRDETMEQGRRKAQPIGIKLRATPLAEPIYLYLGDGMVTWDKVLYEG